MAANNRKKQRYTTDLLKTPGLAFDPRVKDPRERIQAFIDAHRNSRSITKQSFEDSLMQEHLQIISATVAPGRATAVFEMKAAPEFTSRMGNLHGGAVALILDTCTSICAAPLAEENSPWAFGGVSRTLSITYLRPIRESMNLSIECQVLHQGSRLSALRGEIRDKDDGRLLAVAEHNKASIEFKDPKAKM